MRQECWPAAYLRSISSPSGADEGGPLRSLPHRAHRMIVTSFSVRRSHRCPGGQRTKQRQCAVVMPVSVRRSDGEASRGSRALAVKRSISTTSSSASRCSARLRSRCSGRPADPGSRYTHMCANCVSTSNASGSEQEPASTVENVAEGDIPRRDGCLRSSRPARVGSGSSPAPSAHHVCRTIRGLLRQSRAQARFTQRGPPWAGLAFGDAKERARPRARRRDAALDRARTLD